MAEEAVRKGVTRVQGDKLCAILGYSKGSKIPGDIITMVSKANVGDVVNIDGRQITVGPAAISLAQILLDKDVVDV